MNLKNMKLFSKKLIWLLLVSLIFPAFILAQELEGVLFTGLLTDSTDTKEQEILSQGVAKTFSVRMVWTYDQTNLITGPLEALSAAKSIATPANGLEEPLLSQSSGYQKKVIAHSAGITTAVTLAKQGKLWGDELYIVSPALISQDDLRQIRDLTSQGKGFNKIVLYTGDDIIPNFKELQINLKDYTIKAKITENSEVSLTKLVYEDRDQQVNILEKILNDFVTGTKEQIGKEPVSVTIYGNIPGNKIKITWQDGTTESFNLQKDSQTGEDFYDEGNIKVVPLYDGFLHGRAQLEILEKFYKKYGRMPESTEDDMKYFKNKDLVKKVINEVTTAHDPNELLVSPEGDVRPGDELSYTINYENEGEGIAFGVYITDTLEEDLDYSTLTVNGGGAYDPNTRTLTWFIGELQSKQQGSVSFSINVNQNAPDKAEVINFATVYFPSVPEVTRTNGTVNRIVTFIDNVPPTTTASISPLPNQAGWNNSDVTLTLTATDNEGGLGVANTEYSLGGANWLTYTNPFTITTEGLTTIYYKSTDNANNVESQHTLIVKIDRTPPETLISSPVDGAEYTLNEQIQAVWSVTDSLSGVALVSATTPQGAPIDTASVGLKTFKVSSLDNAGNSTEKIQTYYVRYNFGGISPPINPDGSSIFKLSRTIPVKSQLKDNYGNFISSAIAKIYISKINNNIAGTEIEAESTSQATTGNLFRYDSIDNLYIFNLSTNGLSTGTWQVRIVLDDGTSKYVNFGLK
jgi:uncharacterized repeat protein (TIGR01451 family)